MNPVTMELQVSLARKKLQTAQAVTECTISGSRKTLLQQNIVKTCGKCHPDANVNYAKGRIHLNSHSEEAGSIFYISNIFKWLTIITITLLAIHVLLDLFRKIRHKAQT
jgi:hypothetical protein